MRELCRVTTSPPPKGTTHVVLDTPVGRRPINRSPHGNSTVLLTCARQLQRFARFSGTAGSG